MQKTKIAVSSMRYCPILNPNNSERLGTIANGLSIGSRVIAGKPYWSKTWQSNVCDVRPIRGRNKHFVKYQNLQFEEDCFRGSRKSCIDCKKSCPSRSEMLKNKETINLFDTTQ
jgi:hypothetical protein